VPLKCKPNKNQAGLAYRLPLVRFLFGILFDLEHRQYVPPKRLWPVAVVA
jgi:hypothetical protein